MKLIVQKYGGKSLKSPALIKAVAARIKKKKEEGFSLIVVVSAMGQMTNHLIRLARRVVKAPPQRELDMLITVGERISMTLLAMALEEEGVSAISLTGSQSGIITTNHHTDARIIEIRPFRILNELNDGKVVIVAGFQGISQSKEVTTLGRGGSDTTAVALAAALKALRCEILTDVNGIFTADPKLVRQAKLISYCDYDTCLELARLGAKMHPRSIVLAKKFKVPLTISSSMDISGSGTTIGDFKGEEKMESTKITAVTYSDKYSYFSVKVSYEKFTEVFKNLLFPMLMISFSQDKISFVVLKEKRDEIERCFKDMGLEIIDDISVVSIVGEGLNESGEIFFKFLKIIGTTIPLIISSNACSISAVIPRKDKECIITSLHELVH